MPGEAVRHHAYEDDEISVSGLTPEACSRITTPRIWECGLYLDRALIWEKDIPQSSKVVLELRVRKLIVAKMVKSVGSI